MAALPPKPGAGGGAPKQPPKPSNAKSPAEFALSELKKTAASRGISVEKLVAQMVQQYLKEGTDTSGKWDGKI